MAQSFDAQVSAWVAKSQRRIEAVFKQSAQEVFSTAQKPVAQGGNMPVDTGFLRNESFISMLNNGTAIEGGEAYILTILQAQLGDSIFGGWRAEYAKHVEYGARGRQGRRFAGQAAAQWQAIVKRNAAKLRAMQ